jgi:rhamnogalacturonyl hydrolase YesR
MLPQPNARPDRAGRATAGPRATRRRLGASILVASAILGSVAIGCEKDATSNASADPTPSSAGASTTAPATASSTSSNGSSKAAPDSGEAASHSPPPNAGDATAPAADAQGPRGDASLDDGSGNSASDASTSSQNDAEGPVDSSGDEGDVTVPTASVVSIMRLAAAYQLGVGPGAANADWINKWPESVFYMGVMATYDTTLDGTWLTAANTWATGNQWTLLGGTTTPPTRSADNQSAGQVYAEIDLLNPVPASSVDIANSQASIDAMIESPNPGHVDWWWCDALFMAPPLVARLGAATGQAKYFAFLDTMWPDASAALFDPVQKLFWRDATFVNTDTYWSRGNGWVMGGIVRVLEDLPSSDPERPTYVTMLQTLSASIAPLQGADGLWRSDLLHPAAYPNPETSGTSLFTYAMAWGVRQGILDRAVYEPVVTKAWAGLVSNMTPEGRLEYVQGTGSAPAAATASDSYDYGVGAFLLAGSEIAKLGAGP